MGVEADGLVRAEGIGGSLDPVMLCIWMQAHACLAATCVTLTPLSHALRTLPHARLHMHMHSFGGQGQSLTLLDLLFNDGLGTSAQGDPGQKMRCVHETEGESEAHTPTEPSLGHMCNMKV